MEVDDSQDIGGNKDSNLEAVSALEENIRKKGKNAYYFAHENTPKGPAWDGKPEPQRLPDGCKSAAFLQRKKSSFDIYKSTITKYAFSDGDKSVKLYIDIEEGLMTEMVTLDFTEDTLSLVLDPISEEGSPKALYVTKLAGKITKATFKVKSDDKLLVVTLKKSTPGESWHSINDKGSPDHDLV
jgi:hypothetical protein